MEMNKKSTINNDDQMLSVHSGSADMDIPVTERREAEGEANIEIPLSEIPTVTEAIKIEKR